MTLDISGGGLRAALPAPLEQGSIVRFAVELPEGQPVEGLVRVIGQRDDCMAFEFHDIVPADRERLIRAVFASYRRDAAVRRPTVTSPAPPLVAPKDDPRATAGIRRAKALCGLGGFFVAGFAAHVHGDLFFAAGERALGGGIAG